MAPTDVQCAYINFLITQIRIIVEIASDTRNKQCCFASMDDLDDLHTFCKEKYVAADGIQRSYCLTIKNIVILATAAVKCTILGIFITIKSLLRSSSLGSKKDIRNQVALVRK